MIPPHTHTYDGGGGMEGGDCRARQERSLAMTTKTGIEGPWVTGRSENTAPVKNRTGLSSPLHH